MSLLRIVDDAAPRLHHPAGSAGSAVCLAAPTCASRLIERWSILFDAYIMLLTFARNKNAY